MKLVIHHDATVEIARKGAEAAFAAYSVKYAQYRPTVTWRSPQSFEFSVNARGVHVAGTATLDDGTIAVEMRVPFVFRVLESRAKAAVTREIHGWLAQVQAEEAAK